MNYLTIELTPKYGKDGWYRATFSVYDYFGGIDKVAQAATETTGIEWSSFGCFMEVGCIGTKDPAAHDIKKFTILVESI